MIGTGLTVWASLINFGSREINIVVALLIAMRQRLSGGRLFHAPDFGKEDDLFGAGLHRFLFHRVDVSYFVVDGARQASSKSGNMSLKAFHIVFIALSILLAFFCGVWLLHEYASTRDSAANWSWASCFSWRAWA